MLNKFEILGIGACVGLMGLALFMIQAQINLGEVNQPAAVIAGSDVTVVPEDGVRTVQAELLENVEIEELNRMKIDEVKIGAGTEAKEGNTVEVHYVGRLQDGTEFDNSHKRGAPIEFTIGAGQVIAGWEEGIAGMMVGGERVLVIPPEKAYGERGIGPISPNATLEFTVELVSVK